MATSMDCMHALYCLHVRTDSVYCMHVLHAIVEFHAPLLFVYPYIPPVVCINLASIVASIVISTYQCGP
jgi:hypothetical protein